MESTPTGSSHLNVNKTSTFQHKQYFVRSVRVDLFILPTILQDSNHLHNLRYLTEL